MSNIKKSKNKFEVLSDYEEIDDLSDQNGEIDAEAGFEAELGEIAEDLIA